jgi:hypothetical protein
MNTKNRNEILLTLETGAAKELQQSSFRAATAATGAETETHFSLYIINHIHTYIHMDRYTYVYAKCRRM